MGATFVSYTVEGYDIGATFDELREKYVREYGNNGYTGTIASCRLGCLEKKFPGKYIAKNLTEAQKIVKKASDDDYYYDKGTLCYIDLGVISYDVIGVTLEKQNLKPKYELRYLVKDNGKILDSSANKTTAEKALCKLAIEHPDAILTQEYELISMTNVLATPKITVKSSKSQPKSVPNGKVLKERRFPVQNTARPCRKL